MQGLENKISERKKQLEEYVKEYEIRIFENQTILDILQEYEEPVRRSVRNHLDNLLAMKIGYSARLAELNEL
jgi:hypothetical protein